MRARMFAVAVALCVTVMWSTVAEEPRGADPPAEDASFGIGISAAQHFGNEGLVPSWQHQQFGLAGAAAAGPLQVTAHISLQNDGKYSEPVAGFWAGFSTTLEEGGLTFDAAPFSVRAGRFGHADLVDSPYSLFVSSRTLSAMQLDLSFRTSRLFYTSRWVGLTVNSRIGYPDRGANLRFYGLQFGPLRVGFQDVMVYARTWFDAEYLLNPLPGVLIQYARRTPGSPWSEAFNDNSIMGFFADYRTGGTYGYAQILVDDINANAILNPDSYQNPNKIAWSVGGTREFGFGTIGIYHAGATKYTFQPYGTTSGAIATNTNYGYTYHPDVSYTVEGEERVIWPVDNYVGYLHGENNLAFAARYANAFPWFALVADLELTISGSKSPANPWHELRRWDEGLADGERGTRFLDDERLEVRIAGRAAIDRVFGPWRVGATVSAGYVFNELELTPVPPELAVPGNEIPFFVPGTTRRPYASLTLRAAYRLDAVPGASR